MIERASLVNGLIRPSGYYRQKARKLKDFCLWLQNANGKIADMDPVELRISLLNVRGIGPETADSILLYAANKPIFVVDTYTNRVLKRHGWIEMEADYHSVQDHFHASLQRDVELYNEFHALLVRVGHLHCRKTARCDECPLVELLPPTGIVES